MEKQQQFLDNKLVVGQDVTWHYEQPGGYGLTVPVPAIIEKISPRRITIKVLKKDGSTVLRCVKPNKLTMAKEGNLKEIQAKITVR